MLERLQKLFYSAVKLPRLRPLWRVMLKSAPDSVIDFIFKATYALRYSKVYSVPLKRVFEIGRMNRTQY